MHMIAELRTAQRVQMIVTPIMMKHSLRKPGWGQILKYCIRMDSLEAKRCVVRPESTPEEDGHLHYVDGRVPDVQAHALHGLVVGCDAVHEGEDGGNTDESVVEAGLFRNESSCANASHNNQSHE